MKPEAREKELLGYCSKLNDDVSQTLGKALGYPWFKDDPKNFPDATEADGVCVGDHVAESLAVEAANKIKELLAELADLKDCHANLLLSDNAQISALIAELRGLNWCNLTDAQRIDAILDKYEDISND